MYQRVTIMHLQSGLYFPSIDIHYFRCFLRTERTALIAQMPGIGNPLIDAFGKKCCLRITVTYLCSELLILPVIYAQGVAVHEKNRLAMQIDQQFVITNQVGASGICKRIAQQEVPIAQHHGYRAPGRGECCQRSNDVLVERYAGIITYPVLEQIAENVK